MKLIIDIPEEMYSNILTVGAWYIVDVPILGEAIRNGIPLENIKAEIQKALDEDKATDTENAKVQAIALMWCLEIINKHIGE